MATNGLMSGRIRWRGYTALAGLACCCLLNAAAQLPPREIINRADVLFYNPSGQSNFFTSQPVSVLVPRQDLPAIHFFQDATFTTYAQVSRIGRLLYIQSEDEGCAPTGDRPRTNLVYLTSTKTGDREVLTAIETAAGSRRFRVSPPVETRDVRLFPAAPGNGTLETTWNDRVIAETDGCAGGRASATLLIDPSGVVFDSRSDAPVAGARVTLIDATSGSPAEVFDVDGRTPAPSTVVTEADGRYTFPAVPPGTYQLLIRPPPGYTIPSKVPPQDLPRGHTILDPGSYGGNFVLPTLAAVQVDVPADPLVDGSGGLFLQKIASRQVVEPADFIDYTLRIKNLTSNSLSAVVVTDQLPLGFAYQAGSARLEGARVSDPQGGAGPRLQFTVPSIRAEQTVTLTYRVRVGPGAFQGNGVNTAQAVAEGPPRRVSNLAQARVQVQGSVFTDRGIIFGKVFIDANLNGVQDENEWGIPGVRLFLEDGTFVITDSEGKYDLYGLRPVTHVIKVDNITLPAGAKLVPLSNRNAGSGGSQFVELKRSEFHKADFAIAPPAPRTLQEIKDRRAKAETMALETDPLLKRPLTPDGAPISRGDPRALPATGTIGASPNAGPAAGALTQVKPISSDNKPSSNTNAAPTNAASTNAVPTGATNASPAQPSGNPQPANTNSAARPAASLPAGPMEAALTNLDQTLGFVDLKNGDTLPMSQATLRAKGAQGARLVLKVNGEEIPASRIGRRFTIPQNQVEVVEWVGVGMRPGTNRLELVQSDSFGNPRATNAIQVVAPDKLGAIKIAFPKGDHFAGSTTNVPVSVRLQDARGVPVTTRTPLTLDASLGEWKVADLNPGEPGVQVFIEGGSADYVLMPPKEPGDCAIRVSSGALKGETVLAFLPEPRPMIAVGIVEGRISLNSLKSGSIVPARSRDGFEEELRSFAVSGNDGRLNAAGRAAFFLKGKIKGEYLLTAGYDSEKDTRERLFRDIQPDEFYPIYGDAAAKGFDAQSTGRLYVRVDKRRCYLLYGDYLTTSTTEARALGNYSRSLTGIKEHYEKNRFVANLWASQDTSRQVIEELPANGTSGPYFFRTANGIVNSEKVEILTRDRNQPAVIVKSVSMARFTDYEFEPFTGRILFKAPVPSLDPLLNPISIRVTYEVDQGGDKFWVYGADGQVKVTSWLEAGGAAVRDENPLGNYGLYSANTTVKVAPNTTVGGEVAHSETDFIGGGNAERVVVRRQDAKSDALVYWGHADNTFSNTASMLSAGRTEAGAKVGYRVAPSTRLVGQGLVTESLANNGERKGARLDLEHTFPNQVRVEVGGRYSTETANPASFTSVGVTPNEVTSLRTKVTTPVPKVKNATVYGEYENDVVEPDKRLVAVGGDYQMKPNSRLYARHEFINALGGPFELNTVQQRNTTLVGLDTPYMRDGTLFNEYRMRDAITGREAEAAVGLRNLWKIRDGLRANTTFERISPVTGNPQNEATAGTGAIEYTGDPDWKATARLELRVSNPNDSLLNTLGYARKLSRDWTFLGRSIVYLVDNKAPGIGDKAQARFQAGLAWRQTSTDRWNGLGKYEYKIEEDGSLPSADLHRQVHMFLFDLNYQPARDWIISGHYGGKLAFEDSNGQDNVADGHLLAMRVTYDVTKRWDLGLCASALFSSQDPAVHYGLGPEVGFRVHDNVRLAVGYNFFGFRDRDLSSEEYTDHGVYVALRLKFDEALFGLGRKEDKP